MPNVFRDRIKNALADKNLQAALDSNTDLRIQGRLKAFASLPDAQGMRQRAHALREEVITNLDRYLDQFVTKVRAHGITVHRAADARQAVQTILGIAQNLKTEGPVTVAKSKSMISEEIHLNRALEQAGILPVETDLGEYIVQLRDEPPSHIITPAIHLSRQQVGQVFHEKLGVPYTEDIPEMTNTARRNLRKVFLSAQIGLSGVNFGVAETGTLVLMTNEGNGRMVTTLPKIHIALMGMERIVPNLDDLALMMALLPRSATGQKITVYTSLIHSPRQPDEIDGPLERHLIILDNGRGAIRQTLLCEVLYCIRCGACLNACPVFREIGGHAYVGKGGEYSIYPGPIGAVLTPVLFSAPEFGHLARASSLCGACKEACPVDIDLPKMLLQLRAGMTQILLPISPIPLEGGGDKGKGVDIPNQSVKRSNSNAPVFLRLAIRLFTLAAVHPRLFRLAQWLAGSGGKLVGTHDHWIRLPALTGWGVSKDIPRPAGKPFQAFWASQSKAESRKREEFQSPISLSPAPYQGEQRIRDRGDNLPVSLPPPPEPSLLSQFTTELEALGGKVITCLESELAGEILNFLNQRGIQSVMTWDPTQLPAGLLDFLRKAGVRLTLQPDPSLRVGITGAIAGVAETGTLVIPGGVGRPLTASLLPEIHLAVLRKSDIRQTLTQVLGLREVREASAVALVTGPSRTGDIEMSLTIGVHGPGEVHVFCIQ